jgi:hypothetical protein
MRDCDIASCSAIEQFLLMISIVVVLEFYSITIVELC